MSAYDDDVLPDEDEPQDRRWITVSDYDAVELMPGWTGGQSDPLYAISSMGGENYAWVFVDAIANLDRDIGRVQKIGRNKFQLGKGTFTKKEIDELYTIRDALQMALDEGGEVREMREVRDGRGTDAAADDLVLYIEHTSDLSPDGPRGQGRDVLLNALRKWKKGTYDPDLAVKLFEHLVEVAAKRYAKEFASEREWSTIFTPATRREAAQQLETRFREAVGFGEYEHVDTRTGAREMGHRVATPKLGVGEASGGRGGYSLRQSPESATKYDAYFDGLRIGSVRGPFSRNIHGHEQRAFYDWTLNGPRGQAIGRAKTQTAAFNQLIAKHKEWRAIGADISQVGPYDPNAPGPHPRIREVSDGRRKYSMTYGVLPSFEQFERDIRRPDPDYNDGRSYWSEGTSYPLELVDSSEIELAEDYGLEPFETERARTGRNSRVRGFQVKSPSEMYGFLEYLVEQFNDGDDAAAGDLASSIMTTLGYEWI